MNSLTPLVNNDGYVRLDDINAILGAMEGATDPGHSPAHPLAADLNGDGLVGLDDAAAALQMLGTAPGPGAEACAGGGPCL